MRWTAEEDQILRDLISQGESWRDVAKAVGRTHSSVKSRGLRLGVFSTHHSGRGPCWTKEDDAVLIEMTAAGKSKWAVAARLNRSVWAIVKRRWNLGLAIPREAIPRPQPKPKLEGIVFTDEKVGKMATVFAAPVSLPLTVSSIA